MGVEAFLVLFWHLICVGVFVVVNVNNGTMGFGQFLITFACLAFLGYLVWGATEDKRKENDKIRHEKEIQRQLAEGILIHCPHCNAVIPRSDSICLACGMSTKIERKEKTTCSFCGASNNTTNTTCFACGKKIKPTENMPERQLVTDEQLHLDCGKICTRMLACFRAQKATYLQFRQNLIKRFKTGSTASDIATILVTGEIQPGMPSSTVDEGVWNEQTKKVLQTYDMACDLIEQIRQKLATDDEYRLFCQKQIYLFAKAELRMDDMFILMSTKQNLSVSNPVRELLAKMTSAKHFREKIRQLVEIKLERKDKVSCSSCGAINNATNAACFACGKTLEEANSNVRKENSDERPEQTAKRQLAYWQCSYCGTMNKVSKTVCPACGTSLKTEEEAP